MEKRSLVLILLMLLLAACGTTGDTPPIPTAFSLPDPSITPTPQPTLPATWTLTPTISPTPTATITTTLSVTPSATITETPSPTPTPTITPTADYGAVSLLAVIAQRATVLPPGFMSGAAATSGGAAVARQTPITGGCQALPAGGFGQVFSSSPGLVQQIGCPAIPSQALAADAAAQVFERGTMIWLGGTPPYIYALFVDGTFLRFEDTFNASVDPFSGGEVPPGSLLEPVRGFGKVWRTYANVKGGLGWAVSAESAAQATYQLFERGRMIYLPTRGDVLVLSENAGGGSGTWISVPGWF